MLKATRPSMLSQPHGPPPDSQFIMDYIPPSRPAALSTCTKEGNAASTKKRKVAKETGATTTTKKTGATSTTKKPGAETANKAGVSSNTYLLL